MWIQGRRRGGAQDLAKHLQKPENEAVKIHDMEGFAFDDLFGGNLDKALKQMEAAGYGKGNKRNLYHAIIAPAYGETLSPEQRKFMIAYYIERMGFQGLQYCAVEHWKKNKQHFHLVFNIIHPDTGKINELKWTRNKEWRIAQGLQEIFGHAVPKMKGKPPRTWEMQRGKRQGVDPRKMQKEVTAIFNKAETTKDFIAELEKAGFTLTRSDKNKLVLVDQTGDTHGLMRRIEGKKIADLRRKFPGIEKAYLPDMATTVKARKKTAPKPEPTPPEFIDPQSVKDDIQKAYDTSKTGAEFFAKLNKKQYSLGRGLKGFAIIDKNGNRHNLDALLGEKSAKGLNTKFPDLAAIRPYPVSEIIRRIQAQRRKRGFKTSFCRSKQTAFHALKKLAFAKSAKTVTRRIEQEQRSPILPTKPKKGWPLQAIIDWEAWGHNEPQRFFTKWPELAPEGFVFTTAPTR